MKNARKVGYLCGYLQKQSADSKEVLRMKPAPLPTKGTPRAIDWRKEVADTELPARTGTNAADVAAAGAMAGKTAVPANNMLAAATGGANIPPPRRPNMFSELLSFGVQPSMSGYNKEQIASAKANRPAWMRRGGL